MEQASVCLSPSEPQMSVGVRIENLSLPRADWIIAASAAMTKASISIAKNRLLFSIAVHGSPEKAGQFRYLKLYLHLRGTG
jgi:hypothetical protein